MQHEVGTMTHSNFLSRRTLQIATLSLLAAAPVTFGGEPVSSHSEGQLIGHIEVVAAREHALIGSIVVTANRLGPVVFADLGAMTVTATRDTALARNDAAQTVQASL
jgi:hypothetical protein